MEQPENSMVVKIYPDINFMDENDIFIEVDAGCLLNELKADITFDTYATEGSIMSSGTPQSPWNMECASNLRNIIRDVLQDYPGQNPEYFKFNIALTATDAANKKKQYHAAAVLYTANPWLNAVPEMFDEPELVLLNPEDIKAPESNDVFEVRVTPLYTEGDKFDYLDGLDPLQLQITTGIDAKEIKITSKFLDEAAPSPLIFIPQPGSGDYAIALPVEYSLIDAIKTSWHDEGAEYLPFKIIFSITLQDGSTVDKTTTIRLPNPWFEDTVQIRKKVKTMLTTVLEDKYDLGSDAVDGDNGWWTFTLAEHHFQYGIRESELYLYMYYGNVSYDYDFDDIYTQMTTLNADSGKKVTLTETDNYFVLEAILDPETATAAQLEKTFTEMLEFSKMPEFSTFLGKYETSN